ncbi:hypothetical protein RB195_024183 [Necator americanus]|uniref:Uncharacterized protein n=1 Tax=Necator americanus TaxID=51031 RepID=A0ABR1EM65_NECAM
MTPVTPSFLVLPYQAFLQNQKNLFYCCDMRKILKQSNLFLEILTSDAIDDRTPALNSIIPTLGGILDLVEEHREVMVHVEASILKPINCILTAGHVEFYDDVIILLQSLLQNYVSEPMWAVYNKLYEVFKNTDRQTILPFSDIAHVLHKYIVTDNESFLAFPDRMDAMIDMCQTTLQEQYSLHMLTKLTKLTLS